MINRRTLLTLTACASLAGPTRAQARRLTVFAAASLKEALEAIAAAYGASGKPEPVLSFAGSNQLARQIDQGAPADLFISADEDWMNWLAERKLIAPASRLDLLGNRLVLVAPAGGAPVTINTSLDLAGLLKGGRLALPDPQAVPAGKYAKAALTQLGLFESIKDKIAGTENVRMALMLVARGEAPLGIVYATDAIADSKVSVIGTFPADTHPPIIYPAALTTTARLDASDFLGFLTSPRAQAIFTAHGFTPLVSTK